MQLALLEGAMESRFGIQKSAFGMVVRSFGEGESEGPGFPMARKAMDEIGYMHIPE